MADFTHIHVHSTYSILDSTIKIPELVKQVKSLEMSACALTDHGYLFGIIDFYKECKKQGIKPLLGCEIYLTMDPDNLDKPEMTRDNYHMVVLAMNQKGFQNLIWLVTQAALYNFYYTPRVYWQNLLERNEGLIITTACLGGILAKTTRVDNNNELSVLGGAYDPDTQEFFDYFNCLKTRILDLKSVFGDRLYLEIQSHKMWEQDSYNRWVIAQSKRYNIPLVITADSHYLMPGDQKAHALIKAMSFKQTLAEYEQGQERKYTDGNYYLHSSESMWTAAQELGHPEAAQNTLEIKDRCNLELELGKYQYPTIDITKCNDYPDFLKWKEQKGYANQPTI